MDRGGTSNEKKRKVERAFQDKLSVQYFFIGIAESKIPVCLICNESVSVAKEYNIKRHYETKHAVGVYGKLEGGAIHKIDY